MIKRKTGMKSVQY